MEFPERQFQYVEFEGQQYRVEIPQTNGRVSVKARIIKALREHPEGLSKNMVYQHAGCYPDGGKRAIAQLVAAGLVITEHINKYGGTIICRLTETEVK